MRMKYQALILGLFVMIGSLSFADEAQLGTVTKIDLEQKIVEIDGKAYGCSSEMLERIYLRERVEFVRGRGSEDEPVILEMGPQNR